MDLNKDIDELEMTIRANSALHTVGIETVGDLVSRFEPGLWGDLSKIKNCGQKTLDEIRALLEQVKNVR